MTRRRRVDRDRRHLRAMAVGPRRARRTGQAMVEFALIAPLFFFLLFSIIEFGRAVYYIQMLNNAAREGARFAIVHGSNSRADAGPLPAVELAKTPPRVPKDPTGATVVAATKSAAIAIIDSAANAFAVDVRWCANDGDIVDCPGTYGDGDNGRNQTVKVTISYTFQPMIAGVVPLPTFTMTGGSTLVINN
jgi:Flp pilus assembly protein TadG